MEQGAVLSAGAQRTGGVSRDDVLARLAAAPSPGLRRGDHDLNPDLLPDRPLTLAAVLVPLVERPDGLTVLLTRRSDHLQDHAGQISFPGGRVEPGDADALATALREAEEEIGLARALVTPVGRLDTYVTRTGFEVTPVVGLVAPPSSLAPDPFEVAEVFEVPLAFILDPASRQRHSRIYAGKTRHFHVFPWRDYYIWGATAGMLVNLADLLGDAP
jgi:8-oxo-dGTP pyrophosphatase MutT (NUDIX family)